MSFFKDLVTEVQRELNNATAEFKDDLQKSIPGFEASAATHGSQQQGGSASQHASADHRMPDSGVIEHNPGVPANRNMPPEQRPQPKKRRKRPQQQQATATAQPQTEKASPVSAHKLVANLTPAVARSSIIMAEVLGPPVSKRKNRRGWH